MLYVVRVENHHGAFYLKRGELTDFERATIYESPSAAYRAASAYSLVHLKRGGRCIVERLRRARGPAKGQQ